MKKTIEERRLEGDLRMKKWIIEVVTREDEAFDDGFERERDAQIARCYDEETRPYAGQESPTVKHFLKITPAFREELSEKWRKDKLNADIDRQVFSEICARHP